MPCARSWIVGFGKNYPTQVWHKLSYNTKLTYPLAGKNIYSAVTIPNSDGTTKFLRVSPAAKYDFEGAPLQCRATPQQGAASH